MSAGFDSLPDIRSDLTAAFERAWARLRQAGTWWTGAERVALAAVARRTSAGGEPRSTGLPDAAVDAAGLIGARPGKARRRWAEIVMESIGAARYVELVGVVSRVAAIDAFQRALGRPPPPLPIPAAGDPSREEEGRASRTRAWVPMVGGESITQALSLVPAEKRAQEDLHGALYLTHAGMGDLTFRRGLSRAQMELIAARTSAVNECFY